MEKSLSISLYNWKLIQWEGEEAPTLKALNNFKMIPAEVPGCIHYDLVKAGILENPYAGTREAKDAAWVAGTDWVYLADFIYEPEKQRHESVILDIAGIDTYASIWINDTYVGETSNAYRRYEFEIPIESLHNGKNILLVHIKAFIKEIAPKLEAAACLKHSDGPEGMLGKSLIRRYQRSFFTTSSLLNLGTGVLGMGIYRPIEIKLAEKIRVTDCCYRTEMLKDGDARGTISVELNGLAQAAAEIIIQDKEGVEVYRKEVGFGGLSRIDVPVCFSRPHLWWPRNYGEPYLYSLTVSIKNGDQYLETVRQKIGIRTVCLVTSDNGRRTFYFSVNGKKIFIHGQNFIPMDYLKVYGSEEEYRNMFFLMKQENVNLIRLWGGGAVEAEEFFSECDRAGILVWQEFLLHSNIYPDYDEVFVEEFLKESEGIVRLVRKHPCLCLICGGNEQQEGWDEWGWQQSLDCFYGISLPNERVLPIVNSLCPEIPYIYNSPHGGKWAQSPVEGECHNWGNYYNSTKDPLFVTETCWTTESYSRAETLEKYMGIRMEEYEGQGWASKWKEKTSLPLFNRRPYSNWFDSCSLKSYLYCLELEQALADYHAISQFRFHSPSNSGVIYWSFNKGGPLFQFGCVDYGGYPMMSYYVMKRLFRPIAVHLYRDIEDVRAVVSNHSPARAKGRYKIWHYRSGNEVLGMWSGSYDVSEGKTSVIEELKDVYEKVSDRTEEAVFIQILSEDGEILADDYELFCPYSEYKSIPCKAAVTEEKLADGRIRLVIKSEKVLLMARIEADKKMVCSDNYFHMVPGQTKEVIVSPLEDGEIKLRVMDLYDNDIWED